MRRLCVVGEGLAFPEKAYCERLTVSVKIAPLGIYEQWASNLRPLTTFGGAIIGGATTASSMCQRAGDKIT